MSKVWLLTGSASGLGRNTAETVLASGDRLFASARDPGCLKMEDSLRRSRKKWPPFGVKVCVLEPAGMRTNWGARANSYRPDLLPERIPQA
jgi:hypothetical protein